MAIYTKKGDRGETYLLEGKLNKRISKSSLRISAIGKMDELNSYIGKVNSSYEDRNLNLLLNDIQNNLLIIGSILGGSNLKFSLKKIKKIERKIDQLERNLPPLSKFIIPGGSKLSSEFHFIRSLARSAERKIVALSEVEGIKGQILIYMNRLSDLFFVLARDVNYRLGIKDSIWKRK